MNNSSSDIERQPIPIIDSQEMNSLVSPTVCAFLGSNPIDSGINIRTMNLCVQSSVY